MPSSAPEARTLVLSSTKQTVFTSALWARIWLVRWSEPLSVLLAIRSILRWDRPVVDINASIICSPEQLLVISTEGHTAHDTQMIRSVRGGGSPEDAELDIIRGQRQRRVTRVPRGPEPDQVQVLIPGGVDQGVTRSADLASHVIIVIITIIITHSHIQHRPAHIPGRYGPSLGEMSVVGVVQSKQY